MPTGPEMMLGSVFKMLGIKPEEIMETVKGLAQIGTDLKQQMNRIEAAQVVAAKERQEILACIRENGSITVLPKFINSEHKGT